jgi:predicted Zn-dependent protease
MNNWTKFAGCILICATLVISPIAKDTGVAVAGDYISNFERIPAVENRPPKVARWKRAPTIIVCDYAPISKPDIKKAVTFWENLGYHFFTTQYKYDPLNKCTNPTPVGYITLHLVAQDVKMEKDTLAVTHFYVNNDHNEIEWAVVYFKKDIQDTVLEHEIGHALGFLHFDKINHLMNSKWTQGGWDINGLERSPK